MALLRNFPVSTGDVRRQIITSLKAIPLYAILPTLCDVMTDHGLTRAYPNILDLGVFGYFATLLVHMAVVEALVYAVHRAMHHSSFYAALHKHHHSFKELLTPFAGLAFNPADGLLQAAPYLVALLTVPVHRGTHKLLLFCSGLWSGYIHSNDTRPCRILLGPGYHAIHHKTFKSNYGHYTQGMDALFGTLKHQE
jgi:lathosterol oxidase